MIFRPSFGWLLSTALLVVASPSSAQTPSRFAVGAGYTYTRTNLLPGCRCVSMNGGNAEAQFALSPRWSLLGSADVVHRGGLTPEGYALTQATYTGGVRWFANSTAAALRPFAEVSGGGAHASGTLAPANSGVGGSNNSYAFSAGGGLEAPLGQHLLFLPLEAHYLRTGFANTAANAQNDLRIEVGLLFRF